MPDQDKMAELAIRHKTLFAATDLLNAFNEYSHAEVNSPHEDQSSAALEEKVLGLMNGLGGHVLLALVAIIHNTSDPDDVQRFLDDASEDLIREANELAGE
jgi:hypothetical protein